MSFACSPRPPTACSLAYYFPFPLMCCWCRLVWRNLLSIEGVRAQGSLVPREAKGRSWRWLSNARAHAPDAWHSPTCTIDGHAPHANRRNDEAKVGRTKHGLVFLLSRGLRNYSRLPPRARNWVVWFSTADLDFASSPAHFQVWPCSIFGIYTSLLWFIYYIGGWRLVSTSGRWLVG